MKKDSRYEINWPSNHIIHLRGFSLSLAPSLCEWHVARRRISKVERARFWILPPPHPFLLPLAQINIQSGKINTILNAIFSRCSFWHCIKSASGVRRHMMDLLQIYWFVSGALADKHQLHEGRKLRIGGKAGWFSARQALCVDFCLRSAYQ